MAAARNPKRRERDLVTVAQMYVRGARQHEIAAATGVSQQAVSRDIREVLKRWRESQIKDVDTLKARELERLNEVEAAAWLDYQKSQNDRVVQVKESKTGRRGEGEIEKRVQETRVAQCGDPRYLQVVKDCVAKRCQILGLDAPTKSELTGPDGGPLEISDARDRLVTLLMRKVQHEQCDPE